jgi:hypothetical protein
MAARRVERSSWGAGGSDHTRGAAVSQTYKPGDTVPSTGEVKCAQHPHVRDKVTAGETFAPCFHWVNTTAGTAPGNTSEATRSTTGRRTHQALVVPRTTRSRQADGSYHARAPLGRVRNEWAAASAASGTPIHGPARPSAPRACPRAGRVGPPRGPTARGCPLRRVNGHETCVHPKNRRLAGGRGPALAGATPAGPGRPRRADRATRASRGH